MRLQGVLSLLSFFEYHTTIDLVALSQRLFLDRAILNDIDSEVVRTDQIRKKDPK